MNRITFFESGAAPVKMDPRRLGRSSRSAELLMEKDSDSIYNITHMRDIDGVGSAAFLLRYRRMNPANIIFTNYDSANFPWMVERVKKLSLSDSAVIFTDLALDDVHLPLIIPMLKELKERGNTIIWLDHHIWSKKAVDAVAKHAELMVVGENDIECGAEITYRMLCDMDSFGNSLARMVHVSDFHMTGAYEYAAVNRLSNAIRQFLRGGNVQENLRRMAVHVSEGKFNSRHISEANGHYMRFYRSAVRQLVAGTRTLNSKRTVAVAFGKGMTGTDACDAMLEASKADLAVFVESDTRRGHVRRKEGTKFDCSLLCNVFDGGGHPYAGGFELDKKRFGGLGAKERDAFIRLVEKNVNALYG